MKKITKHQNKESKLEIMRFKATDSTNICILNASLQVQAQSAPLEELLFANYLKFEEQHRY